jgi:hypothetical protein
MTEAEVRAASGDGHAPGTGVSSTHLLDRGARLALAVFVLIEFGAGALFLWAGQDQWFFLDEWDFLANRSAGSLNDWFRTHYEHWTTLPMLAYRGMWSIFGLHTYAPYQALSIVVHLCVAAALRAVMRRSGVGPWIATIAAGGVALFGAGQENVVWAFQITFTGALLFGLIHLLLADHDGAIRRRDWWGLAAGLAALMFSGPGLVMVLVVGLASLVRRGWRAAAFHLVPLLAVYGLWFTFYSDDFPSRGDRPSPGLWLRFVGEAVVSAFEAIGQSSGVAVLLAALIVAGYVVGSRSLGVAGFRNFAAAPSALFIGGIAVMIVTGYGRAEAFGTAFAGTSRYVYVMASMAVPAIAFAAEQLVRRWPKVSPVVLVLLVVGIPGNIAAADDRPPALRGDRRFVLALPLVPVAEHAPAETHPVGYFMPDLTLGWLRDGVASGEIPNLGEVDPRTAARASVSLALQPRSNVPTDLACEILTERVPRTLQVGDIVLFDQVQVSVKDRGRMVYDNTFNSYNNPALEVIAGPLDVLLGPANSSGFAICR